MRIIIVSPVRWNRLWIWFFSSQTGDILPSNPWNTLLKFNRGISHHDHCVNCCDCRWGKHTSSWVAVSGWRRGERILTDANLFCFHALICVNRQSRSWDQCGCAWISSLVWTEPSSCLCWHRTLACPCSTVKPHYVSALDPHKTGN